MTSGLEWEFEDVFAGRPTELESRARRLQTTAEAISRAADALRDRTCEGAFLVSE